MALDSILAAIAVCVLCVLALVWIDQSNRALAQSEEGAEPEPPAPSLPPTPLPVEFTRPLDPDALPATEQLPLSDVERDAQVRVLQEWIGELNVQTDLRADPTGSEQQP